MVASFFGNLRPAVVTNSIKTRRAAPAGQLWRGWRWPLITPGIVRCNAGLFIFIQPTQIIG